MHYSTISYHLLSILFIFFLMLVDHLPCTYRSTLWQLSIAGWETLTLMTCRFKNYTKQWFLLWASTLQTLIYVVSLHNGLKPKYPRCLCIQEQSQSVRDDTHTHTHTHTHTWEAAGQRGVQCGDLEESEGLVHLFLSGHSLQLHLGQRLRDTHDGLQLPDTAETAVITSCTKSWWKR